MTKELKVLKTVLFLERKRTKKNFYAKLRFAERTNPMEIRKKRSFCEKFADLGGAQGLLMPKYLNKEL